MRESEIERHLVKRVTELGGECRKVNWIGRRGAPDRLVMLPARSLGVVTRPGPSFRGQCFATFTSEEFTQARTIWVELKAPGKMPEPHQVREHKRMRDMGQQVEVIDSIEAVDNLLGDHAS